MPHWPAFNPTEYPTMVFGSEVMLVNDPNKEERLAIIQHYLSQRSVKVADSMDLRHFVEITEGRSPADLERRLTTRRPTVASATSATTTRRCRAWPRRPDASPAAT